MGLFTKKKEKPSRSESEEKVEKKTEKSAKSGSASGGKVVAEKDSDSKLSADDEVNKKAEKVLQQDVDGSLAYKFIVRPWITEKTHDLMASDKYVFKIRQKTTKRQAKNAVEKLYGVEVKKINVVNIPQKKRRFGRIIGKKSAVKKAIVTLKKGNKIEVFE